MDWINACIGPAGVDVALCRTDLALMHGPHVAKRFLDAYCRSADRFAYDPYWDLDAIFDMCLPQPVYYGPWRDLGLGAIHPRTLEQRVDSLLEDVMRTIA